MADKGSSLKKLGKRKAGSWGRPNYKGGKRRASKGSRKALKLNIMQGYKAGGKV